MRVRAVDGEGVPHRPRLDQGEGLVHFRRGEVAQVHIHHAIEPARRVKTQGKVHGLDQLVFFQPHLGLEQVAPVPERKFHFVAIAEHLRRGQRVQDLRFREAAQMGQCVGHQLAFDAQLLGIADVLPFAAAAHTEVGTGRRDPGGRWRGHLDEAGLEIILFDFEDGRAHTVPHRRRSLHKNRQPFRQSPETLLPIRGVGDVQFNNLILREHIVQTLKFLKTSLPASPATT